MSECGGVEGGNGVARMKRFCFIRGAASNEVVVGWIRHAFCAVIHQAMFDVMKV